MIQRNESFLYLNKAQMNGDIPRLLANGNVVEVKVLRTGTNGSTVVSIHGTILTAQGTPSLKKGETFMARVRISGSSLFLDRLGERPDASTQKSSIDSLLEQSGLPADKLTAGIVRLFTLQGMRLDPAKIRLAYRTAAGHPGKEERYAEAFMLLEGSDSETDEGTLDSVVNAIEGNPSDNRDFFSKVNKRKKDKKYWLLIPFTRYVDSEFYTGSLRLLVDEESNSAIAAKITARIGHSLVDFDIVPPICDLNVIPQGDGSHLEKLTLYLSEWMAGTKCAHVRSKDDTIEEALDFPVFEVEI